MLASAVMASRRSANPLSCALARISCLCVLELDTHVTLHLGYFSHTYRPKDPQPQPRSCAQNIKENICCCRHTRLISSTGKFSKQLHNDADHRNMLYNGIKPQPSSASVSAQDGS